MSECGPNASSPTKSKGPAPYVAALRVFTCGKSAPSADSRYRNGERYTHGSTKASTVPSCLKTQSGYFNALAAPLIREPTATRRVSCQRFWRQRGKALALQNNCERPERPKERGKGREGDTTDSISSAEARRLRGTLLGARRASRRAGR